MFFCVKKMLIWCIFLNYPCLPVYDYGCIVEFRTGDGRFDFCHTQMPAGNMRPLSDESFMQTPRYMFEQPRRLRIDFAHRFNDVGIAQGKLNIVSSGGLEPRYGHIDVVTENIADARFLLENAVIAPQAQPVDLYACSNRMFRIHIRYILLLYRSRYQRPVIIDFSTRDAATDDTSATIAGTMRTPSMRAHAHPAVISTAAAERSATRRLSRIL